MDFLVEMGMELPGGEAFTMLEESTADKINKICFQYDRKTQLTKDKEGKRQKNQKEKNKNDSNFKSRATGPQRQKKNPPRHAKTKHKFFPAGGKIPSEGSSGFIPKEKWDKMNPEQRQKATETRKKKKGNFKSR